MEEGTTSVRVGVGGLAFLAGVIAAFTGVFTEVGRKTGIVKNTREAYDGWAGRFDA
jgi:hypothetical protein